MRLVRSVAVAASAVPTPQALPVWRLDDLSGRLVELSGERATARLTAAFGLVLEAQLASDRAAWVTCHESSFFPPDAAAGGVDVESLPVIRITSAYAAARAAEHLVRSGGFGLVVIDLASQSAWPGARPADAVPLPLLTRLLGLARAHHAAVVILTTKAADAPSLNSLIPLRAEAQCAIDNGKYLVRIRVLKDKRRAPGWDHLETCRGSAGMR